MIVQKIDGISFNMKEACDFSFLKNYGHVFCTFSQNDSGNISFGVDDGKRKFFIKIAGANTIESFRPPQESIESLKKAVPLYDILAHPNLIQLVEHFSHNDLYVVVFKWSAGDCLFDYWNFEKYANNPKIVPPKTRFRLLPIQKKVKAFNTIIAFLAHVESKGYVAVDFYDGSIMYDFKQDNVTICDIDFFRQSPTFNDMGKDFWGTKRLKAPEEYVLNAKVDSVTNVFTIGALLLSFFGDYTNDEIDKMYKNNSFYPSRLETWELSKSSYEAVLKAVNPQKANRYGSIAEFWEEWKLRI